MHVRLVLVVLLVSVPSPLVAAPPLTPEISEPASDGRLVSGEDVHMVTGPFADPDGDGHLCSDWEISDEFNELVWYARCATGGEKVHIHLGDGTFTGNRATYRHLEYAHDYVLRVRHRDDSGDSDEEWSDWGTRAFRTYPRTLARPMSVRDILSVPAPRWTSGDAPLAPLPGTRLRIEFADRTPLLEMRDGATENAPPLTGRSSIRVLLETTDSEWTLPASELTFENEKGDPQAIYLPALEIEPQSSVVLWVSANGGTHWAERDERAPDFTRPARGAPVPWRVLQKGYVVEHVAGGLQLPVNIAFVAAPGDSPQSPLFYVSELYGRIKVVTRSGEAHDFATGLLDEDPSGEFPGSGEAGLAGLVCDPESGDLFATAIYRAGPAEHEVYPRVIRLRPSDDGLEATAIETVVAFPGETQSASHQISNITIGPDRMLYVHVGDSGLAATARDLGTIRGKILRIGQHGYPLADNPFFNLDDLNWAADYIYALGFRNPFGGAWRAADQSLYVLENGPATDRLSKLKRGEDYGWDGTDESMRTHALATWTAPAAPVQIAFVQRETFDGSAFPEAKHGNAYVTESGPTWGNGPQPVGKRITELSISDDGSTVVARRTLIEYDGTGRATVAGIAAGPDGLYFTDLYKDYDYEHPVDRGANVFRIRWTGYADFSVDAASDDRLTVDFVDRSHVPAAATYEWHFGDGTTSSQRNVRKRYDAGGVYIVRLHVTTPQGRVSESKQIHVGGRSPTLQGSYFTSGNFTGIELWRDDAALAFDWGSGSPFSSAPSAPFSVRWRATLVPRFSEAYRFSLHSRGSARVLIDGGLLIDARGSSAVDTVSGEIELEAGREYALVVEYSRETGPAAIRLTWESDSQGRLLVPRSERSPRRRAVRGGS